MSTRTRVTIELDPWKILRHISELAERAHSRNMSTPDEATGAIYAFTLGQVWAIADQSVLEHEREHIRVEHDGERVPQGEQSLESAK